MEVDGAEPRILAFSDELPSVAADEAVSTSSAGCSGTDAGEAPALTRLRASAGPPAHETGPGLRTRHTLAGLRTHRLTVFLLVCVRGRRVGGARSKKVSSHHNVGKTPSGTHTEVCDLCV